MTTSLRLNCVDGIFVQVICKLIYWLFYSLGTLSAWLLVAMTVQRAINVVCMATKGR